MDLVAALPPEQSDGFWIHRFLDAIGVTSHVVDSSSIEVKRRRKKRKTDRLDLEALLRLLIRYWNGASGRGAWSGCRDGRPKTHATCTGS